ncbi:hypothetical protein RCL1_000872 [Eukaryota sp. TZLM3-RCL]
MIFQIFQNAFKLFLLYLFFHNLLVYFLMDLEVSKLHKTLERDSQEQHFVSPSSDVVVSQANNVSLVNSLRALLNSQLIDLELNNLDDIISTLPHLPKPFDLPSSSSHHQPSKSVFFLDARSRNLRTNTTNTTIECLVSCSMFCFSPVICFSDRLFFRIQPSSNRKLSIKVGFFQEMNQHTHAFLRYGVHLFKTCTKFIKKGEIMELALPRIDGSFVVEFSPRFITFVLQNQIKLTFHRPIDLVFGVNLGFEGEKVSISAL